MELSDATVSDALEQSIDHWKRNASATSPYDVSYSSRDCALCSLFYHDRCNGCPVMKRTGFPGCLETPYEDAASAVRKWKSYLGENDDAVRAAFVDAAQKEVAFLEGLR